MYRVPVVLGGLWAALAVFSCKSSSPSSAPGWVAQDLGPGRCVALNAKGQVLGIDDDNKPFVVTEGVRAALGAFEAGATTVGVGLSDTGEVVGYSEGLAGRTAVRYSAGAWRAIEGVERPSAAISLGPQGQIVGIARKGGKNSGFLIAAGALTPLPLPEGRSSAAYAASGERVAGVYETAAGETHGFLFAGGQLQDLGTLGGKLSAALGMNKAGDVVGAAELASGARHAFLLPSGKTAIVDIHPADADAGASQSDARGIDDAGDIALNVEAQGLFRPIILVGGKTPADLLPTDPAGQPYVGAHVAAISPDGRMVGWGTVRLRLAVADGGASPSPTRCLLWTRSN